MVPGAGVGQFSQTICLRHDERMAQGPIEMVQ